MLTVNLQLVSFCTAPNLRSSQGLVSFVVSIYPAQHTTNLHYQFLNDYRLASLPSALHLILSKSYMPANIGCTNNGTWKVSTLKMLCILTQQNSNSATAYLTTAQIIWPCSSGCPLSVGPTFLYTWGFWSLVASTLHSLVHPHTLDCLQSFISL